jgi:hypothetical protein
MPLSFMPPKGPISVEMIPSLMPTMPYSSPSATRHMRPFAAVKIGGEAKFGVVGHLDRLVVGVAVLRWHSWPPKGSLVFMLMHIGTLEEY